MHCDKFRTLHPLTFDTEDQENDSDIFGKPMQIAFQKCMLLLPSGK